MESVIYPQVPIVRPMIRDAKPGVEALVCFTAAPTVFTFAFLPSEGRYRQEIAACRAVISAAVRQGLCVVNTNVIHIRRRRGVTRVSIISSYLSGLKVQRIIRTGISRENRWCEAAADACLQAIIQLPEPDPGQLGIRVRL